MSEKDRAVFVGEGGSLSGSLQAGMASLQVSDPRMELSVEIRISRQGGSKGAEKTQERNFW